MRLIDEQPRPGAEGALVAFIHPSSAHGVLVELKQAGRPITGRRSATPASRAISRYTLGRPRAHLALRRLLPARWRRDVRRRAEGAVGEAGAARRAQPHHAGDAAARRARRADDDHRRGPRRQGRREVPRHLRRRSRRATSITRWPRRVCRPTTSTSCSPRTCTSITPAASPMRDAAGRVRPRFPRAQYVVRRGEWEDATHPHERNRASYLAGQLRAARRGRRAAARRRRPDDHAGRAGAAHRRPHDASPDGADRVGRQDARRSSPI